MNARLKTFSIAIITVIAALLVGSAAFFAIKSNAIKRGNAGIEQAGDRSVSSDAESATKPTPSRDDENVLRFLVWEGYAPQDHIEHFQQYIEKKYNKKIRFEISYVSNSDSFYDPIRGKDVDLISPGNNTFNDEGWALIDNGLILPLDLENIPNFKNISPVLQDAEYFNLGGNAYAAPLVQGPYGLVYNTELVDPAPESWDVLWSPEYRGKYVIAEGEHMDNCMVTALALGYSNEDIQDFDTINNEEFREKLAELAKNAHSFWDGTDKPEDLLGHCLATSWGFALKGLEEKGEIWRIANPKEGTLYWVDNYCITWALKDKPFLKKVAEEWINYTLSPEFQVNIVMRDLSCFPVTTDLNEKVTDEEKVLFHLDAPEEYQKTRIREPALSLRNRHGLERLWRDAMEGISVEKQE